MMMAGTSSTYDNVVTIGTQDCIAVGVLQNAPDAQYKAAEVAIYGTCKLKVSAEVACGAKICSGSTGLGETVADAASFYRAIALEYGTTNQIIEVLLVSGELGGS
jgi:hypothetical protein